jgi:cytochrome c oxidase subunit 2
MANRCAGCHTIRGTEARGQVAPDLTHMASRSTVGAGTLPNTPEHLEAWVRDPQASKPGNQMPPNPLAPDDLEALLAYLGTLR